MAVRNLNDLFLHGLKDIYYAERQILRALPKMAKKADSDQLRSAFEEHRGQTEEQIHRLQQVFEAIGKPARGVKCQAIEGIIEENEEIMGEVEDEDTLDAAMIASAQSVEHYEISRYGTLIAWAGELGMDRKVVDLLSQTLEEEKQTDQRLTRLAEERANRKAKAA
jgi:ferritin-like metal-binding protein YciE